MLVLGENGRSKASDHEIPASKIKLLDNLGLTYFLSNGCVSKSGGLLSRIKATRQRARMLLENPAAGPRTSPHRNHTNHGSILSFPTFTRKGWGWITKCRLPLCFELVPVSSLSNTPHKKKRPRRSRGQVEQNPLTCSTKCMAGLLAFLQPKPRVEKKASGSKYDRPTASKEELWPSHSVAPPTSKSCSCFRGPCVLHPPPRNQRRSLNQCPEGCTWIYHGRYPKTAPGVLKGNQRNPETILRSKSQKKDIDNMEMRTPPILFHPKRGANSPHMRYRYHWNCVFPKRTGGSSPMSFPHGA